MSAIKIKYDELEESSKYAKKLAGELEDYSSRITKRISNPVNSLPGNDKNGYASNIISSASAKIKELNNRSSMFDTYAGKVETFVANAQQADKKVEKAIRSSAESYIGKRSWWQAACDAVYNFLFVDLANSNDVFRFLSDVAKTGWSYVTSFAENARDWFKHGEGKYWYDLITSGTAIYFAVVGAIKAVAAIALAATPVGLAIAIVAAVAAVFAAVITVGNSVIKGYHSAKAIQEDDPGVARYISKTDSFSEMTKHYDMGNAEKNQNWEKAGEVVDTIDTVCGYVDMANGLLDMGAITDVRSKKVVGYKFSKENIKFNLKNSFGFDHDSNSWNFKKMFSIDDKPTDKLEFALDVSEGLNDIYNRLEDGLTFETPMDAMNSAGKIGYTILDGFDMLSGVKVFSGFKTFLKPTTSVLELFGISEDKLNKASTSSFAFAGGFR